MTLGKRHFSWGTWRFEKAGPILESQGTREILKKKGKKMLEKGKKGQNIWKFGQKCTKFENILKKGSLKHATIACMKQLE